MDAMMHLNIDCFVISTLSPRMITTIQHLRPTAYDVISNFEQRWRKATESFTLRFERLRSHHDDTLINAANDPRIVSPSTTVPNDHPSLWVSKEDDPEQWHVQVFRSIDSESVKGFPINAYAAEGQAMFYVLHVLLRMSYSLLWGITMQMMYNLVAQDIKSARLENAHPTDYLNFYCLGNRDEYHEEGSSADTQTSLSGNSDPASQEFRRFMIYVHSKGMVVDDAYIILGSANVNERSIAGNRDTEIAMGAFQPHYTWAKKKEHPRGQIYGYRMSLWAEHIGSNENCFKDPETLECVKYVNGVAEENWKRFTSEQFTPLQGHILKYPVEVDSNGNVKPLPGHENFPDVGGEVQGCRSCLPYVMTT
ncbi:hypothetical protein DH2020_007972 [Rehmannia glutinosa]|uniref:phospholipase D n=1 Tax=Rehmannia glutinosa TaxID=99300 RepID=A0ABR0TZN3_REHGL